MPYAATRRHDSGLGAEGKVVYTARAGVMACLSALSAKGDEKNVQPS